MITAIETRVAAAIVDELWNAGVRRIYGIPGGGSNMTLISAAAERGITFVLAHHEPAAVFMAAGEAEVSGVPGVCLATVGPGVANSINGLAHCKLDRVPLLLITDRAEHDSLHQALDHAQLVAGVAKSSEILERGSARAATTRALARAIAEPAGPVHLDLSPAIATATVGSDASTPDGVPTVAEQAAAPIETATALLEAAGRPVAILGLGARDPDTVAAVRSFVEWAGVPVLCTYKAKGVLPDGHPLARGLVTNGSVEDRVLRECDAILAVGFDTVELMPGPWRWERPTVTIARTPHHPSQVPTSVDLCADPATVLGGLRAQLECCGWRSEWPAGKMPSAWIHTDEVDGTDASAGASPGSIAEVARRCVSAEAIATVDAGSHMFAATLFWPAPGPRRFLISNGLATMGYSLPAAIGASLACPGELVVCFTGDGGLAMVAGELETAVRLRARVVVVVFNDSSLNLIKIKQEQRGGSTLGLDFGAIDWASVAAGMGMSAYRTTSIDEFETAFREAVAVGRPALVDVRVDPTAYPKMLGLVRG